MNFLRKPAVARAVRTFVITTLVLFVPGLLGWLHSLTDWANSKGTVPFPDAHGLWFLAVSAVVGGFVAVVNLVWNLIEDSSGKAFLRQPGA